MADGSWNVFMSLWLLQCQKHEVNKVGWHLNDSYLHLYHGLLLWVRNFYTTYKIKKKPNDFKADYWNVIAKVLHFFEVRILLAKTVVLKSCSYTKCLRSGFSNMKQSCFKVVTLWLFLFWPACISVVSEFCFHRRF